MDLFAAIQPEKQSADAAISVVCDRLEHATLLQDRRAAVLSLKGFSREHKEAVAAEGLRGLLKSLSLDRDDEETLKATLECLLQLFAVEDGETVDDTALWIADEFTLKSDNVLNLLEIVVEQNFYTRLHALQILACILECRQTPLQECIMSSATGVSTLVELLNDGREQIRNEALLLLVKVVRGHTELQKRAAFENIFEKCFAILDEEGGLEGGIVTSDCFSLLGNLLANNVSNQNWFRETGLLAKITHLLQQIDKEAPVLPSARRNLATLFELCRLFVPRQSTNKAVFQDAAMKAGIVTQAIAFAFHSTIALETRAAALAALADLIYDNEALQAYFSQASGLALDPLSLAERDQDDISSLVSILLQGGEETFQMRYAALMCVEAFAAGNHARQLGILQKLIDAYLGGAEESLVAAVVAPAEADEYRTWFACCALLRLTRDDEEAQTMFTELTVGDAAAGEEEVSFLQTLSGNLVASLQRDRRRSAAGYLQLLCCWLFDAKEAVADFLEEGSTLQTLLAELRNETSDATVKGLCASLLSICYAFDFAESTPMPRAALQAILLRVGRDSLVESIVHFSFLDALRRPARASAPSAHAVLDDLFIDFFRDTYGTIRKAIDVAPTPERKRSREAQAEFERSEDVIADLEAQLAFKSTGLAEALNHLRTRQEELGRMREELKYLNQKHASSLAAVQKDLLREREACVAARSETAAVEAQRKMVEEEVTSLRAALATSSRDSGVELDKLRERLASASGKLESAQTACANEASQRGFLEKELTAVRAAAEKDAAKAAEDAAQGVAFQAQLVEAQAEMASLKRRVEAAEKEAEAARLAKKTAAEEAAAARTRAHDLSSDLKGVQQELVALEARHAKEVTQLREAVKEAETKLADANKAPKEDKTAELQASVARLEAEKGAFEKKLKDTEQVKSGKSGKADKSGKANGKGPTDETVKALEERIKVLETDKEQLKTQLDQAQEDLMLLMDDQEEAA